MDIYGTHTISGYIPQEIEAISDEVRQAIKSCSKKKKREKDKSHK